MKIAQFVVQTHTCENISLLSIIPNYENNLSLKKNNNVRNKIKKKTNSVKIELNKNNKNET